MMWLLSLGLLSLVDLGLSARILVIFPFPFKSHHIFAAAIVRTLVERGHEVVEYSPHPPKTLHPRHVHVEISTRFQQASGSWTYEDFLQHPAKYDRTIFGFRIRRIWEMNYEVCEDTFQHPRIQELIKSNQTFDLVMTESTFGEESMLVFGHRFSAPTISIETFFPWCVLNSDAGNALSVASVRDLTATVFNNPSELMQGFERLLNAISVSISLFNYHFFHLPAHQEIIKKNFDYPNTPPLAEMVRNISLYLTNSHPAAVAYVQPYTPNIIPIGGISIDQNKPPLPQDIQKFMDEAEDGVIYFSLGTIVPVHLMPRADIQIFTNVFKKLRQRVLWKVELDSIPDLPSNVMIKKWIPQNSVLAHPNCLLFITHGGLFSTHEAIYSGVPTVGIPVFADQPYNVMYNVHRGIGVKLDFKDLSEDRLYKAVTTVLSNPTYKVNAQRMSQIYRDRPLSPADSLVFWVEYVLRHGGAPHLRPMSARLSWYQLNLLDILATVFALTLLLYLALYIPTIKYMKRKLTKKPPVYKKKN